MMPTYSDIYQNTFHIINRLKNDYIVLLGRTDKVEAKITLSFVFKSEAQGALSLFLRLSGYFYDDDDYKSRFLDDLKFFERLIIDMGIPS